MTDVHTSSGSLGFGRLRYGFRDRSARQVRGGSTLGFGEQDDEEKQTEQEDCFVRGTSGPPVRNVGGS